MKTHTEKLKEEIEITRAILQTYLPSDLDIDKMPSSEIMEFVNGEIERIHDEFLIRWKDYAWLRSQLKEAERHDRIISKIKEKATHTPVADKNGVYLFSKNEWVNIEEINKIDQEEEK
jgi:type IV secretory pathway TrbF-like protein